MIRHEQRAGCAARGHDTWWAYDRHGCRCPAAVAGKDRRRGPRPGPRPVDPARVAAAVRGERVRLSEAEARAGIDVLAHLPAVEVAAVLLISPATVYNRRALLSSRR